MQGYCCKQIKPAPTVPSLFPSWGGKLGSFNFVNAYPPGGVNSEGGGGGLDTTQGGNLLGGRRSKNQHTRYVTRWT